jgi:hypothetical protein
MRNFGRRDIERNTEEHWKKRHKHRENQERKTLRNTERGVIKTQVDINQGMLKGDVSLYRCPPV